MQIKDSSDQRFCFFIFIRNPSLFFSLSTQRGCEPNKSGELDHLWRFQYIWEFESWHAGLITDWRRHLKWGYDGYTSTFWSFWSVEMRWSKLTFIQSLSLGIGGQSTDGGFSVSVLLGGPKFFRLRDIWGFRQTGRSSRITWTWTRLDICAEYVVTARTKGYVSWCWL